MTETEKKALALVNEVREERLVPTLDRISREFDSDREALCRAIEAHEAYKQEVSVAVELRFGRRKHEYGCLGRFILPKPDPLVEALQAVTWQHTMEDACASFRAAIEARGGRIVWEGE